MVKIQPVSPDFPLVDVMAEAFCWLSIWNFKAQKHQPFPMAQPNEIIIFMPAFISSCRRVIYNYLKVLK